MTSPRQSGPDFTHVNGATGELLLPEVIGSGGALFDFDNDGDLDLFAVQSGALRPGEQKTYGPRSRLYRNDRPTGGQPAFRFTDVTDRSGIVATGYGMGAAVGDIDNDGWVDLFVTGLGSSQLFRNNGDGTFTRRHRARGHGRSPMEHERDVLRLRPRRLARPVRRQLCEFPGGPQARRAFPRAPRATTAIPQCTSRRLTACFATIGDGTFSDVTARAGLARSSGRGLGVLASDFNGDGWTDLYVANDGDANQMWINQRGSGVFTDEALLAGVAVNRMGQPQGSMGVDAADIDRDGDEDLFVTNLDNEGNTLYLNVGDGLFEDRTAEFGLFKLGFTGFGTRFVDYDNDGWLDLLVVNGAVRHSEQPAPERRPVSAEAAQSAVPQRPRTQVRGCV